MKKVAIFIPSLMGGGAEKVMLNLCRGMLRRGIAVDLVLARAAGEYMERVPAGARIVDLKCRRILTALPGLAQYLKRESPSVLLSALEHANVIALWACRLSGVPTRTVITLHTNMTQAAGEEQSLKSHLVKFLVRRNYPRANEIIAVSRGVADSFAAFLRLPVDRIRVIYNPVITPDVYEMSCQKVDHPWLDNTALPLVLTLGRLSEQKDYYTLLHAFAIVVKRISARLLILGEGEMRPRIEKMIQELGLSNLVSMPGFSLNPYAYMKKASVVVLSSRAEGLPNVLIEALALGVPIVSTDCPSGPDEILKGGRFGTLVPVGDREALAEGICATLSGPVKVFDQREAVCRFEEDWAVNEYLQLMQISWPERQSA